MEDHGEIIDFLNNSCLSGDKGRGSLQNQNKVEQQDPLKRMS
jgi:hypothetical protein